MNPKNDRLDETNRTPEFVVWAIGESHGSPKLCKLRDDIPNLPQTVWRELRPLIEFNSGMETNRIFEGICFQNTPESIELGTEQDQKGFSIEETLQMFGGEERVKFQCLPCPANALQPGHEQAICGCVGVISNDRTDRDWEHSHQISIPNKSLGFRFAERVQSEFETEFTHLFPKTRSHWHSVWMSSVWSKQQTALIEQIFASLFTDVEMTISTSLRQFHEALKRCVSEDLVFHSQFIPAGRRDSHVWRILPFCSKCKSSGVDPEIAKLTPEKHRNCNVCGHAGYCHPPMKRKTIGDRPYWELRRFLGPEEAERIVGAYKATVKSND